MPTPITVTVGHTSRDYSTLHGATAGTEIVDRVSDDTVPLIELYNDDDTDIISNTATIAAGAEANKCTIQPALGHDYADGDYTSKALSYNPADGVGIKTSSTFSQCLYFSGAAYSDVVNLQIFSDSHQSSPIRSTDASNTLIGCLVHTANKLQQFRGPVTNCLFIVDYDDKALSLSYGTATQCTFVCPSDISNTSTGVLAHGTPELNNCAVFGFGADESGIDSASDWNATDRTAITGSNSITSQTYADQFEVVTDAAQDWRMKAGNDLDGAGDGGIDIGFRIPDPIGGGTGGGGGRIMGSLAGLGGLAGPGGLAGRGGGLAG